MAEVPRFVRVTCAPAIAAPLASRTVPRIDPNVDCPYDRVPARIAQIVMTTLTKTTRRLTAGEEYSINVPFDRNTRRRTCTVGFFVWFSKLNVSPIARLHFIPYRKMKR